MFQEFEGLRRIIRCRCCQRLFEVLLLLSELVEVTLPCTVESPPAFLAQPTVQPVDIVLGLSSSGVVPASQRAPQASSSDALSSLLLCLQS